MDALANIRVVDLTEALAGPYCAMLLGDLGADVIKIERPGSGDQSRRWGARLPGGESAYFCSTNRNKRSVTLDIRTAAGREALYRLLAMADVLLCNIPREESLRRAGLDAETVRAKFPRVIYASITGYGRTGPNAGRSGYDLVAQGEAGLMSVTGTEDSAPIRFPIPIADMTTGLYTCIGIQAALRVRDQTGQGQVLDMSLLESQAAYLTVLAGDYFATGQAPRPLGNTHPGIVPYQVFHTADKDIVLAVGTDRQWTALGEVLGLEPALMGDPRLANNVGRLKNRAEVVSLVQDRLAGWASVDILHRLQAAEIPCGPINSVADSLADPHYLARDNIVCLDHPAEGELRSLANPVRLSDTPAAYRLPPPRLGEHTDEVLGELGYGADELMAMRRDGVI
jgi:crotonobetainyl-CoA:carnitine CoA-transferase CaiB-like acyl-CoA transferase